MTKYQTVRKRILAALVDILILSPLHLLEDAFQGMGTNISAVTYLSVSIFASSLVVFYYVACHAISGQTLGKRVLNLWVVDHQSEEKIAWRQAILRSLLSILALPVMIYAKYQGWLAPGNQYPSLFWPIPIFLTSLYAARLLTFLFHPKHRRVDDFLAGTVVVWKEPQASRKAA